MTKAQVEKLPEEHPDRARFAAMQERKLRMRDASSRNKKRMAAMRKNGDKVESPLSKNE